MNLFNIGNKVHRINVQVIRHGPPQKDPETGASLDALTEEGKVAAVKYGSELYIPSEGIIGLHSPKERAYETLAKIFEGAGVDMNTVSITARKALDTYGWTDETKMKTLIDPDGNKRSVDQVCNYLMNDVVLAEGDESFDQVGTRIISFLHKVISDEYDLSDTKKDSSEELCLSVTHCPVVEAGVIGLLRSYTDKKIQTVADIGGGTQPLDGFVLSVDHKGPKGMSRVGLVYKDLKVELPQMINSITDYRVRTTLL